MTFCFCIDDDTHVVVHDDVIHRDYSRVINKCGKKKSWMGPHFSLGGATTGMLKRSSVALR